VAYRAMTMSEAPQIAPPEAFRSMSTVTSLLPGAAMYARPLAMMTPPCTRWKCRNEDKQPGLAIHGTQHTHLCLKHQIVCMPLAALNT
jgi:hypothetical protein